MAELRIYRTYRYVQKNPVIDKIRTIVQDEGLFTRLGVLHEISGVSVGALDGWFHGDTKNPQHGTVMAVLSSLGYVEQFVKEKDIDLDKERKAGKAWLVKRAEEREAAKPNGGRKPKKAKK